MNTPTKPHLGERLRRLAAGKGVRPKQLAADLGTSVQYVSKLYCGRRRFTPKVLDQIVVSLNVEHMALVLHRQAAREYGFRIGE